MFIAFGLFAAVWAYTNYQMGTAVRMGPAYFPIVLGGLLTVLGLSVFVEGLTIEGPRVPTISLRPLILISVACVVYGYVMKPLGLVVATGFLVFISAFGGHEFKWREVAILYVI